MLLFVLVALVLWTGTQADINGQNPPAGTCLCVTASSLNVRGTACGAVLGGAATNECFIAGGEKITCQMSSTWYEFFRFDYFGQDGWGAGTYLRTGTNAECNIIDDAPTTEFRGIFLTTAWNVDYPSSAGLSTTQARGQLSDYVTLANDINANAYMFQVRPAGDAFYASTIEPWSRFLTGTQGLAPSPAWDPLNFVVTEAHLFGIEVHAWLNPYRANLSPTTSGLAANHMCLTLSQYCYTYGNYMWMDPGADAVVDHLVSVIDDIATRYDVDGIHFDDYFYPYPDGTQFPDASTYAAYVGGGGSLSRDDWRRDNVNRMIQRVHLHIRLNYPSVKFSISPFGLYRPGHPIGGMPPPIAGMDPYTELYADSKHWLQQGWVDFFAPQQYWSIASAGQSYPTLLDWWLDENTQNVDIYVANGVYKCFDSNNWPVSEIENQVQVSRDPARRLKRSLGNIMYSAKYFRDNSKGIADTFRTNVWNNKATMPQLRTMSHVTAPHVPAGLVSVDGDQAGLLLRWEAPRHEGVRSWAVYTRSGDDAWQLLRTVGRDVTSLRVYGPGTYAVRGMNSAHALSDPVVITV